jgi:ornithine carbamoyltransferase
MNSTGLAAMPAPLKSTPKLPSPLTVAGPYSAFTAEHHGLRGVDLVGIEQLSAAQIAHILSCATSLKANISDPQQKTLLSGCSMAMLFEKPSLRTRVTFELGMIQLGGSAINLEGKLGVRESVKDIARNLDRWVDVIMARTFDHATILELAEHASVPVINGLSDIEHPCQALADLLTIQEHKGHLDHLNIAYVGDPNNVSSSLMLGAAKMGADFVMACPPAFYPNDEMLSAAAQAGRASGAKLRILHDPIEAVSFADVVYTDTWVSMGQESEADWRKQAFNAYQVNSTILSHAKPDAIVMHCLPAHRGAEITDEVIDGRQSVVLDQAENRLHAQKAILTLILGQ